MLIQMHVQGDTLLHEIIHPDKVGAFLKNEGDK